MKLLFLACLFLLGYSNSLSIVEDQTCSAYKCNADKILEEFTCVYYEDEGNTYYLKPCAESQYCNPVTTPQNSTCLPYKPASAYNKWPGEKCKNNESCNYGKCQDGYCKGKLSPQSCTIHDECDAGLRCFSNICKSQALEGSSCTQDYDCANNLTCNNGICEKYFKHDEGEIVTNCVNGYSYSCKYTQCHENKCLRELKSEHSITTPCTSNQDCKNDFYNSYPYDFTIYTECQCGMNPIASSFCALFPGDEPKKDHLSILKKWAKSKEIGRCHTVRRFADECVSDFWDSDKAAEYSYYSYRSNYWPQLQQNDECTKTIYQGDYASLKKEYEDADDSSMIIGLGGMLLVWLI
jgi:hypothetical protein